MAEIENPPPVVTELSSLMSQISTKISELAKKVVIVTAPDVPALATNNDPLSVIISGYTFTLVSKSVLHDRRYVNFDVFRNKEEREPIYELAAYTSSSQVGSWRLCIRNGNNLDKFDDYVQSTLLHWKLSKLCCDNFYSNYLKWDDENHHGETKYNITVAQRNFLRNNAAVFGTVFRTKAVVHVDSAAVDAAVDSAAAAATVDAAAAATVDAVDMSHVIYKIGLLGYRQVSIEYYRRSNPTNPANTYVTHQILGRGVGQLKDIEKNKQIGCNIRHRRNEISIPLHLRDVTPLLHGVPQLENHLAIPAPYPFNYWIDKGICGENSDEGIWTEPDEPNTDEPVEPVEPDKPVDNKFTPESIKWHLKEFSELMKKAYDIEEKEGKMIITELYSDRMSYKNFVQSATIFNVKMNVKSSDVFDPAPVNINIIYAHYTIKQYDLQPNTQIIPMNPQHPHLYQDIEHLPEGYQIINTNELNLVIEQSRLPQESKVDVQGFYIMSILPETKLGTQNPGSDVSQGIPAGFPVNEIGLYIQYIKGGHYVCKPLDYPSQCNPGQDNQSTIINEGYLFIGDRFNFLFPINTIYDFLDIPIKLLSDYKEQILFYTPTLIDGVPLMRRSITKANACENVFIYPGNEFNADLNVELTAAKKLAKLVKVETEKDLAAAKSADNFATNALAKLVAEEANFAANVKEANAENKGGSKTKTKKINRKRKFYKRKTKNKKRKSYKRKSYKRKSYKRKTKKRF